MVRVYATCPPDGYPYWVVKPGGGCRPRARVEAIIVDNGAFRYYVDGSYPELDRWIAHIARTAASIAHMAEEVYVILPDYVLEPARTFLAALRSMRLCRKYRCMVVMHYSSIEPMELRHVFDTYMSALDVDLYAVPLKHPASRGYSARKRSVIVDEKAELRIIGEAVEAAREHGVRLHLLAPTLRAARIAVAHHSDVIASIDTTAWTRSVTSRLRRVTISARSGEERRLLLEEWLKRLGLGFTGHTY